MCLMGPIPQALGMPETPKAAPIEPGPASPDDMVNNQKVENISDRSQQDKMRNANRGQHTTAQTSKY